MKLATVNDNGNIKAGMIIGDEFVCCVEGEGADMAVLSIIRTGDVASWDAIIDTAERRDLADVQILAPIPHLIRDMVCVGKNYYAHAKEFFDSGFDATQKETIPSEPIIFTKAMTSLIGPNDAIDASIDPTDSVDYEGELGVIISKTARRVAKADWQDYVFGYVIINDVTSRELQKKHNQWTIGKGLDTFGPMGPYIVTKDEIDDLPSMQIQTLVNDEVRQQTEIRDLIFDIPTLIETLTLTGTLLAGDVIATGTPVGVGIGFTPPKFLKSGDVVTINVTGLGSLTNPVI
ncbi:MAG: fumarylacetoacetate hydrolase family protein [Alphaproteobacteria bacterium]|nr:fumarylacetoacetate hydrolase family protein [Alphaproteobacteria bacterium]